MFLAILAVGFVFGWGTSRGGFSFLFMFLLFMFVCMALKGGRGWHNRGCSPQHNQEQGRGPGQQRPTMPEDLRPYQGQPAAPGNPYYGSPEGTPTVRTDANSGTGTVRVDRAPGSTGEPTTPLREQPRPEEPRARVESDLQ
jgi:hypothetical protein